MFTSLVLATGLYTHLVLRVFFYYGWSHYCLIIASTFYTYEVMKYDSIKYPTHCLNQLLPLTRNTQHTYVIENIYWQVVPFNCRKTPLSIAACLVILSPD